MKRELDRLIDTSASPSDPNLAPYLPRNPLAAISEKLSSYVAQLGAKLGRTPLEPDPDNLAASLQRAFLDVDSLDALRAAYRDFVGLKAVGGEPPTTGLLGGWWANVGDAEIAPVKDFHASCELRAKERPTALTYLRSADSRLTADQEMRLLAAVQNPRLWRETVLRWREAARDLKVDGWPDPAREFVFYQLLLVAWPAVSEPTLSGAALAERIVALGEESGALPALAEAPVVDFIRALFGPHASGAFLKAFVSFAEQAASAGVIYSLARLVLLGTVPGLPMVEEGDEHWMLTPGEILEFAEDSAAFAEASPGELLAHWRDGRLKRWTIRRLLELRRCEPVLFLRGEYSGQKLRGLDAEACLTFSRQFQGRTLLVVVPRLVGDRAFPMTGEAWGKAAVEICGITTIDWTNVFTGKMSKGPYIALSDAFETLPFAVFIGSEVLTTP